MQTIRFRPLLRSLIWLVLLSVGFSACRDEETSRFTEEERDIRNYMVGLMQYWYFWNQEVPNVDIEAYETLDDLMAAMTKKPLDRWSYVTDEASFDQYYSAGEFIGLGLSMRYDANNVLRVSYSYPNSPAGQAGMVRGTKILSVNGVTASPSNNLNAAFGANTAGVQVSMQLQDLDGGLRQVNLTKRVVDLETVLHRSVHTVGGKKVGYVVFNHFIERAEADLRQAFQFFAAEGIQELVVDLRYNGGGMVSIAQYLAGLISNPASDQNLLVELRHNAQRQSENSRQNIKRSDVPMSFQRVVFLTTDGSASASEVIINGLKPFMNVVVIGERTYGKPVGSYGFRYKGYVMSPITFKTVNAQGLADYFEGIEVNSLIADDLSRNFGDPQEAMLKEAFQYLSTGALSNSGGRQAAQPSESILANQQLRTGFRGEIGVW